MEAAADVAAEAATVVAAESAAASVVAAVACVVVATTCVATTCLEDIRHHLLATYGPWSQANSSKGPMGICDAQQSLVQPEVLVSLSEMVGFLSIGHETNILQMIKNICLHLNTQLLFHITTSNERKILFQWIGRSGQRSKGVGTCHLDCHCMGSNPARGSYENGRWDDPLHRRCPNDPKQDMSGRPANDS